MKALFLITCFVFMVGCAAYTAKSPEQANADDPLQKPLDHDHDATPLHRRIYQFQHLLIPNWVYETDGAFFADLQHGVIDRLAEAASEMVSEEYSYGLAIVPIEGHDAILIRFPEPKHTPNCYFAIVERLDAGFMYHTYESSFIYRDEGIIGVVGAWDAEGSHLNRGPRGYESEDAFIEDVLGD